MAGSELIHSIKITGAVSHFILKKTVVSNYAYPRAEIVHESFLCKITTDRSAITSVKGYKFIVFLASKWSFLKWWMYNTIFLHSIFSFKFKKFKNERKYVFRTIYTLNPHFFNTGPNFHVPFMEHCRQGEQFGPWISENIAVISQTIFNLITTH